MFSRSNDKQTPRRSEVEALFESLKMKDLDCIEDGVGLLQETPPVHLLFVFLLRLYYPNINQRYSCLGDQHLQKVICTDLQTTIRRHGCRTLSLQLRVLPHLF